MKLCVAGIAVATVMLFAARSAAAQERPQLVLTPPTGPCDATITATGIGFPPGASVSLELALPGSDVSALTYKVVTVDAQGGFVTEIVLGADGCHNVGQAGISIYADQADQPDDLELYTRANYVPAYSIPPVGRGPVASEGTPLAPVAWLMLAGGALAVAGLRVRRSRA
jgi:hypothetical protein